MPEIKKLIAGDKTYAVGRWIPTKERLPEVDERYLVTVKCNFVTNLTYVDIAEFACHEYEDETVWQWEGGTFDDPIIYDNDEITAWMELPELYKEGTYE